MTPWVKISSAQVRRIRRFLSLERQVIVVGNSGKFGGDFLKCSVFGASDFHVNEVVA